MGGSVLYGQWRINFFVFVFQTINMIGSHMLLEASEIFGVNSLLCCWNSKIFSREKDFYSMYFRIKTLIGWKCLFQVSDWLICCTEFLNESVFCRFIRGSIIGEFSLKWFKKGNNLKILGIFINRSQ